MISKDLAWPRGVEESKDKEAKMTYRQKCESFATYDSLLFKLKRRKKPETGALVSTRATGARLRDENDTAEIKIRQGVTLEFIKRKASQW